MNTLKFGFYSSILLVITTLVTFSFAITAIPVSGPFCTGNCIDYPYLNTLQQYPKDYIWMFICSLQLIVYLAFIISIHYTASKENKIFSAIGVVLSTLTAGILLIDYFIQFTVIPVSLRFGETEGIAILTQYNPRGIFIALEELGYILMCLSFVFIAPVFENKNKLESSIRWTFFIGFIVLLSSFISIITKYGINREYRFEVTAITINWLVIIVSGILISIYYKRKTKYDRVIIP